MEKETFLVHGISNDFAYFFNKKKRPSYSRALLQTNMRKPLLGVKYTQEI